MSDVSKIWQYPGFTFEIIYSFVISFTISAFTVDFLTFLIYLIIFELAFYLILVFRHSNNKWSWVNRLAIVWVCLLGHQLGQFIR